MASVQRRDLARDVAADAAARFSASVGLTGRQAEVLAHVVRGASNREIAHALGCAEVTVEKHLATVFARAQVRDRARLVLAVLERSPPFERPAGSDLASRPVVARRRRPVLRRATRDPLEAPRGPASPVERAEAFARRLAVGERAAAVLRLLVHGMTNKEIAAALGYAEVTIETQLTAIYRAARVRGRRELLLAILAE